MQRLSPKTFARLFVQLRNSYETAVRLGIDPHQAKTEGARLVSSPAVKREIDRLDSVDEQMMAYVRAGLARLAFGSANDAAALMFSEQPGEQEIASADLFNVSEIKRVKGGGVEMKFFDRQKALEKLVELDDQLRDQSKAEQFIAALNEGSSEDISHLLDGDGEVRDNDE